MKNLPNILSNISKVLIMGGVLLLGFVAYQIWGTGLQHSRAQNALRGDFQTLINETSQISSPSESVIQTEDGFLISSITQRSNFGEDTNFQITDSVIDMLPDLYKDRGQAIARISNERIGLNEIVVEGTTTDDLKKGPGHYLSTPFPGQPGNVSFAGHRTVYGSPFDNLHKFESGDEIIVETIQGEFRYRVLALGENGNAFKIVKPHQNEEIQYQDGNHLTLTSCHPRYSAQERIIVRAELIGDPVVPLPRPDQVSESQKSFTSQTQPIGVVSETSIGLGGDSGATLPTILLSLALLVIVIGTIFARKRWDSRRRDKWVIYSSAALPFLATTIFLYYFVDRLLPSF